MATYAIVTIASKTIIAVESAATWAEALSTIEAEMGNATAIGWCVSVKGTWRRPYAKRGERERVTSFSAYTRGYSQFTYIKKVNEGEDMPEEGESKGSRDMRSFEDIIADNAGVRRARNMAEREELRHCWEMGDFDY